MIRSLIIASLLYLSCNMTFYGQIPVRNSVTQSESAHIVRKDSTDITIYGNPQQYIGEDVILYQNRYALHTDKSSSFSERYDGPLFTYFEVIEFITPQTFGLKEKETGKIYYFDFFGEGVKPVMSVNYFLKTQKLRQGKRYCIEDKDGMWEITDTWLREGGISHSLKRVNDTTSITLNTLYGQKPFAQYEEYLTKYKGKEWVVSSDNNYAEADTIIVKKGKAILVFKDNAGKSYEFDIDRTINGCGLTGVSAGYLPNFTKEDADHYVKKFGLRNWKKILEGLVTLGMTEEMVRLTVGMPDKTYNSTSKLGIITIWDYGYQLVIFHNGKVVEITDVPI